MTTYQYETDTLTKFMWYASGLILLAAVVLAACGLMGPLEGPADMPVPPSATNYSTN